MILRIRKRRPRRRPAARGLTFAGLILVAACSGPAPHQPHELFDRGPALESEASSRGSGQDALAGRSAAGDPATGEPAAGDPADGDPADGDPAAGGDRSPDRPALDTEELVGLGEFGLLPSLLEALSPLSDCDPDDPMSPCQ